MKTSAILSSLVLTTVPSLAGPPPPMEAPPPPPAETGWQFRVAPYVWLQALEGTTGVRGVTGDVDMSISDILDDLDIAFMGAFEARHGRWGIMTDLTYAELSDSFETRDILFSGGDIELKQLVTSLTLSYRALESESHVIDLYGGARLNWIDMELGLDGGRGVRFTRSGDDFWADAIIGVRCQTSLGGPWFLRVVGDVGAGESDFTWQAAAILGYRVSDNCNVGIGYRGLGTDYENGGFTYDVTAHGPVFGAEWRF
jgi:hypothetical protein